MTTTGRPRHETTVQETSVFATDVALQATNDPFANIVDTSVLTPATGLGQEAEQRNGS
jgi:hypothetical protein